MLVKSSTIPFDDADLPFSPKKSITNYEFQLGLHFFEKFFFSSSK